MVFPIAWAILYLCMGISLGLILNSSHYGRKSLIRLFILQLIFNFTWSIFFFYMQNPLLGFLNIILLEFLIIVYSVKSYGINKISRNNDRHITKRISIKARTRLITTISGTQTNTYANVLPNTFCRVGSETAVM